MITLDTIITLEYFYKGANLYRRLSANTFEKGVKIDNAKFWWEIVAENRKIKHTDKVFKKLEEEYKKLKMELQNDKY